MTQGPTDDFYATLPAGDDFSALLSGDAFTPLPDGWVVGIADIAGSTEAIAAGRYKVVNTVGAAVISAQVNAHPGLIFPYVFGGDGAAFAVPPGGEDAARDALAATRRWAESEFGFDLRAAIVPLADIRAAGQDVCVARHRASPNAVYAMFDGGGMAWAEERMKAGSYLLEAAPKDVFPDLTGLSCRWTPMSARAGHILSLLVVPNPKANPEEAAGVLRAVVELTAGLERNGHPVPPEGPGYRWIPDGLELEARATHRGMPLAKRKRQLLAETFIAWLFFRTGLRVGGFDPKHYTATTGANADFRKLDDGLKMTLDCDAATRTSLEALLADAQARGLVRYGLVEQDNAIMTCIVPSVMEDNHVHFVDGAQGGYTAAARAMKGA
ncbi:DUF3095 domain-containing protein [Rhizobiaceae bacterium]|nr:DUF3095 domain-containing protein [Rhizobiaceae bacterium]